MMWLRFVMYGFPILTKELYIAVAYYTDGLFFGDSSKALPEVGLQVFILK